MTAWSASPSRVEAFEAITAALPVDSVGYENAVDDNGHRGVVDRLRYSARAGGELQRLVESEGACAR